MSRERLMTLLAAAAAIVGVGIGAGLVLAPAEARVGWLPPAWSRPSLRMIATADGGTVLVAIQQKADRGTVGRFDALTRVLVRDATTGEKLAQKILPGQRRLEPAEDLDDGAVGAAHVWLRPDGGDGQDVGPVALALPDLRDITATAGAAPRGPLATPPDPVCTRSQLEAPSGRAVRLTGGERQQVDPGVAPGQPEPEQPPLDQHGHPTGPSPKTATGEFYRAPVFLCDPDGEQRAPIVLGGKDLVLLHRPERSGEEVGPTLTRVTETADQRWTRSIRTLLPEADADLGSVRLVTFWARPHTPSPGDERVLVGTVWQRGTEERVYVAAVDGETGDGVYLTRITPPTDG